MKLFSILGTALALCLNFSLSAGEYCQTGHCNSHPKTGYIFGYGGVTFGPDIDAVDGAGNTLNFAYEDGYNVGGGIGIYSSLFGGSRFEIEGLLTRNELDSAVVGTFGNVKIGGASVNLLKEFCIGGLKPYIGGGIGYGSVDIDFFQGGVRAGGTSDTKLILQGIVGADLCITPCWSIFTQYKYMNIGETDFGGFEVDSFGLNNVSAGLRYSF